MRRTFNYTCWTNTWVLGTSEWRTEKESRSNENGYENTIVGSKNSWYGKNDRAKEESYNWYFKDSGNDEISQISSTK